MTYKATKYIIFQNEITIRNIFRINQGWFLNRIKMASKSKRRATAYRLPPTAHLKSNGVMSIKSCLFVYYSLFIPFQLLNNNNFKLSPLFIMAPPLLFTFDRKKKNKNPFFLLFIFIIIFSYLLPHKKFHTSVLIVNQWHLISLYNLWLSWSWSPKLLNLLAKWK